MMDKLYDEVTGVYAGTLVEDMIDTVIKYHRPFINCDMPDLFTVTTEYPLVYVPTWFMSLPLLRGDKVRVVFHQDSMRYPVLWKLDEGYDQSMVSPPVVPSPGELVTFPTIDKVIAVQRFAKDFYFFQTAKYTVLRSGEQFTLFSADSTILSNTNIAMKATDIKVEADSYTLRCKELVEDVENRTFEAIQTLSLKANAIVEEATASMSLKANEIVEEATTSFSRKAMEITDESTASLTSKSAQITVEASAQLQLKGSVTQITGGTLQVNGLAAPSGSGPFCGLPACLFSGAPHVGNVVLGT